MRIQYLGVELGPFGRSIDYLPAPLFRGDYIESRLYCAIIFLLGRRVTMEEMRMRTHGVDLGRLMTMVELTETYWGT